MMVWMVVVVLTLLVWCALERHHARHARPAARLPWGLEAGGRDAERFRAELRAARDHAEVD